MVSCGGIDGAKVGGEYCDCMKKENLEDQMKCAEAWAEKYKDAKASAEEEEIMKKTMIDCAGDELKEELDKLK